MLDIVRSQIPILYRPNKCILLVQTSLIIAHYFMQKNSFHNFGYQKVKIGDWNIYQTKYSVGYPGTKKGLGEGV